MLALPLRVPSAELTVAKPPPTRVFCERGRIRLIPKALTFWEGAKRQQVDETKRDSCRRRERMPHESGRKSEGGYRTTPVSTERVRKLLRIEGIAGCWGTKECVIS